jgi:hypothetical protein
MAAVANNPKFAKKAGVPASVGQEFMKADKAKKMKQAINKSKTNQGTKELFARGGKTKR